MMPPEEHMKRRSGHVFLASRAEHVPEGCIACILGEHIKLEPKALGTFLQREIPARAEDLLVFAGAVAFTDRQVTRHYAKCWERDLRLSTPVRDLDFWNSPDVRRELEALLETLTGDSWVLEFRGGRDSLPADPQGTLPLIDASPVVIPYSNGLDSFAVARLCAKPNDHVIRVSTGRIGDTEKKANQARIANTRWVAMPISLPNAGKTLREQSYRSRGFLFGAVAATAAGLMQGSEIIVPESGQGTFGPALTVVGNEHPDGRMSPVFTAAFGQILSRVFESPLRFTHPRIWHTKGETLEALRLAGLSDGWDKTLSCSRSPRDRIVGIEAKHCGVCANCLLRRQSLLKSDLSSATDTYIWRDLLPAAPWIEGDGPTPGKSDVQQAVSAALAMHDFAALKASSSIVVREATAMATALGQREATALNGVSNVLQRHREEWSSFLDTLAPASLFRELGALQ